MVKMNEYVASYSALQKEAAAQLQGAKDIVESGKLLDEAAIQTLSGVLSELANSYQMVRKSAEALSVSVPNDASVEEIASLAVDAEANGMIRILTRFVGITADSETYQRVIQKEQEKDTKLIAAFDEGTADLSSLAEAAGSAELFLQAMQTEDIDASGNEELVEKVTEVFPSMWTLAGLVQHSFHETEPEQADASHAVKAATLNANKVAASDEGKEDAPDHLQTASSEAVDAEETENIPKKEEPSLQEKKPDPSTAHLDKEAADNVETAAHAEAKKDTFDKSEELPAPDGSETEGKDLLQCTNTLLHGTVSASSFRNTLRKLPKVSFFIIPALTTLGIVTEHQLACYIQHIVKIGDQNINWGLVYLVEKGYVACFVYEDRNVYCLSAYTKALLAKESVRKLPVWKLNFGGRNISSKGSIERSIVVDMVSYNDTLITYLDSVGSRSLRYIKTISVDQNQMYNIAYDDGCGEKICVLPREGFTPPREAAQGEEQLKAEPEEEPEEEPQKKEPASNRSPRKSAPLSEKKTEKVEPLPEKQHGKEPLPEENTEKEEPVPEDDSGQNGAEAAEKQVNVETALDKKSAEDKENLREAEKPKAKEEEKLSPASAEKSEFGEVKSISSPEDTEDDTICRFLKADEAPDDDEFYSLVHTLADRNSPKPEYDIGAAITLARAASFDEQNVKTGILYQQMMLASGVKPEEIPLTADIYRNLFEQAESVEEPLLLATAMNGMLTPYRRFDHALHQAFCELFREYETRFPHYLALKPLFNYLMEIWIILPDGFSPAVFSQLGDKEKLQSALRDKAREAKNYLAIPHVRTNLRNLQKLYNKWMGEGSDIYQCLESIVESKTDNESLSNMKLLLQDYYNIEKEKKTDVENYILNSDNIEEALRTRWRDVNQFRTKEIDFGAHDQIVGTLTERLELIRSYLELCQATNGGAVKVDRVKHLKDDILEEANRARKLIDGSGSDRLKPLPSMNSILIYDLDRMICHLSGSGQEADRLMRRTFEDFLRTGIVPLDEEGYPHLEKSLNSVHYYEPWRLVLRHLASDIPSYEEAKRHIKEDKNSITTLYDNRWQDHLIDVYEDLDANPDILAAVQETYLNSQDLGQINKAATDEMSALRSELEYSYLMGRINETEKDDITLTMMNFKEYFFAIGDFGCWRQFLCSLRLQIQYLAERRKALLEERLWVERKKAGEPEPEVLKLAAEKLEKDMAFSLVEEYLNRYDMNDRSAVETFSGNVAPDGFAQFMDDDKLFRYLDRLRRARGKENQFRQKAEEYVRNNVPGDWSSQYIKDSTQLIREWPTQGANRSDTIKDLVSRLGIDVSSAVRSSSESAKGSNVEVFELSVVPTPKNRESYEHPIAEMGTQMNRTKYVIIMYGNKAPGDILSIVQKQALGPLSIVLLDGVLDDNMRRQVSDEFHRRKDYQNTFLLIDQMLFLYLALHRREERLPLLLKCTLPLIYYQPFVQGNGATTDEMFCGRSKELINIRDPKGTTLVYGGRQLGKTALLLRAESLTHNPKLHNYAVYCSIYKLTKEKDVVSKIIECINEKVRDEADFRIRECDTIKALCSQLKKYEKNNRFQYFLLLLDEADSFLEAISADSYSQLQSLVDFKDHSNNHFKFVLAGLHNVYRARNATENNGLFGQTGMPLVVRPLDPRDAYQLIARPLQYLGFSISEDDPAIRTILINTNYYPGLLQYFGYVLVNQILQKYDSYYSARNGNPPFKIDQNQLGSVMNDAQLNKSIQEKFLLSLRLDSRYYMIARIICLLYYMNEGAENNWTGCTIHEISEVADEYGVRCLSELGEEQYLTLIDEMIQMGILRSREGNTEEQNTYRLLRTSFVELVGKKFDDIDAQIRKAVQEENTKEGVQT